MHTCTLALGLRTLALGLCTLALGLCTLALGLLTLCQCFACFVYTPPLSVHPHAATQSTQETEAAFATGRVSACEWT
jgi:hypothetical protein